MMSVYVLCRQRNLFLPRVQNNVDSVYLINPNLTLTILVIIIQISNPNAALTNLNPDRELEI